MLLIQRIYSSRSPVVDGLDSTHAGIIHPFHLACYPRNWRRGAGGARLSHSGVGFPLGNLYEAVVIELSDRELRIHPKVQSPNQWSFGGDLESGHDQRELMHALVGVCQPASLVICRLPTLQTPLPTSVSTSFQLTALPISRPFRPAHNKSWMVPRRVKGTKGNRNHRMPIRLGTFCAIHR